MHTFMILLISQFNRSLFSENNSKTFPSKMRPEKYLTASKKSFYSAQYIK